jgi:formiminoglutamate deiminase
MSHSIHAAHAWLGGEATVADVRIVVDGGSIARIERGVAAEPGDERVSGVLVPGLVNAHSHAFHRALRGRSHRLGGDFWTWREAMYGIAGRLDPDSYRELATAVYAEMALAGITGVGEFHYVHHRPDGSAYADPNEMGRSLVDAAAAAGVRIALLDVAYLHASATESAPRAEQRRFADADVAAWLARVEALGTGGKDWTVGLAPHSVRAVYPAELAEIAAARAGRVVHVHVSEQPAENEAALEAFGATPTGVLAEAGLLGDFATAVHATHVTDADVALLGGSGCGVCMCPTTERDLADGIGPASEMASAGAVLSLGSDSHAVIDLFEEARATELDERLSTGRRGLHAPAALLTAATLGGARALGWDDRGIAVGAPADLVAVSLDSVRMADFAPERAAAHVVFAASAADVSDVWSAGRRVVRDGCHVTVDDVAGRLRDAIAAVASV